MKLFIRFDRKPPELEGVDSIVDITHASRSTALERIFTGNAHQERFKVLVIDGKALLKLLSALADT